tara:strand:- start:128 stop:514 length:387 start_codon:yes stop_codon:yes gene_type:complete
MEVWYNVLVFMLVLVSIMLIGIILVQSGQGDMGAAMGGNTMNQAFGSEGADKLLVRITTALATIFMILAISIQFAGKGEASTSLGLPSNLEGNEIPSGEAVDIDTEEKTSSKEEGINTEPTPSATETE